MTSLIDRDRLNRLIGSFPEARVVVVGDLIVDHYLWGIVQRISPEAPVPVVDVRDESRRLGGAANVANNIRSLGGRVEVVGLVGPDPWGDWLTATMEAAGMGIAGVVRDGSRPTSVKTRIVAHSQQVVRVDRESRENPRSGSQARLREAVDRLLVPGSVAVLSDYGKGVFSGSLLAFIRERARSRGIVTCVDPKSRNFGVYRGFTIVTPNLREAEMASHMEIGDEADLVRAGRKLMETLESEALLITRSEQGMSLFDGGRVIHIPTTAQEVYDVTGAGDTVLATMALARSAGASFLEAAVLANLAAGIVVSEVGTSTVAAGELLEALGRDLPAVRIDGAAG